MKQCVEATGIVLLVHRSFDWRTCWLTALEEDHCGNHGDAVTGSQCGVLVDIHLDDDRPAIVLPRDLVDAR